MAEEGTEISEKGQEVSALTGAAYKDVASTDLPEYKGYDNQAAADDITKNTSGLDYVDEDKSTVRGQLNSLLAEDSPYITQARLSGEKESASKGMLNSSMAAGNSQAAAISAAVPIAAQDASTYAAAQGKQQAGDIAQAQSQADGIVSGYLSEQKANVAAKDAQIANAFTAAMQGASESNTVLLNDMQNSHNTFLQEMINEQNLLLQRENTSADTAKLVSTQASTIMQNYQISVENMLTDPDFLDLGADAVNNAINNVQTLAKNTLKFVGSTAGVDLGDFVDYYLTDISVL